MKAYRRSPLALVILGVLFEGPMHPYRMQQLIKERGKDEVANVRQRASLYQTIDRLERDDLITVVETAKDEKRPERTVYDLTSEGRRTLRVWLREILAAPAREFPEFPAALAFMMLLEPQDVLRQLENRANTLTEEVARLDEAIRSTSSFLDRLFVLETEYQVTIYRAELVWVQSVIDDLREGRIQWTEAWIREFAARLESPS